jgi:hypothetical protein
MGSGERKNITKIERTKKRISRKERSRTKIKKQRDTYVITKEGTWRGDRTIAMGSQTKPISTKPIRTQPIGDSIYWVRNLSANVIIWG